MSETPTPILSYKKQPKGVTSSLQDVSPAAMSPSISSPIVSSPGTPTLGSRKVSSRRKALQEFYKLQEADSRENVNKNEKKTESEETQTEVIGLGIQQDESEAPKVDVEKLTDPAELEKYIQTTPIEQMLRLRNLAAGKLNYNDVEKKSIIYDNYYELIKLSLVLSNLNVETVRKNKISDEDDKPSVTDKYVEDVLGDLANFLADEGALFNQDFELVVENVRSTLDDADSGASVQGIAGK